MKQESAAKKYARFGKKLNEERLTRGERRQLKQERQDLISEHGPGIRRESGDVRAKRKHFTLQKPRVQGVVVLVLDDWKEPSSIFHLPTHALWPAGSRTFDKARVAQALRELADRLEGRDPLL